MSLGKTTSAVYRWERKHVDAHDRALLTTPQIEGIVRHVWSTYGLSHPPKIVRNERTGWSYGSRLELSFGRKINTATVLHEICHALDGSIEYDLGIRDESSKRLYEEDAHGPNWVGLYVNALDQFMPQPELRKLFLMGSLHRAGIKMSHAPKLRCLGL